MSPAWEARYPKSQVAHPENVHFITSETDITPTTGYTSKKKRSCQWRLKSAEIMELLNQIPLLNRLPLPEVEGLTVFAFYTDEHFYDDFPWQRQEGLHVVILEAA